MKETFARPRRLTIAFIAIALSVVLFRSQLAQSLVVRGDDFMYRGQNAQALTRYARALYLDPDLGIAVDRYVFLSMQLRDKHSLQTAFDFAAAYLSHNPNDATVLSDRATCYLVERRYRDARRDFESAARIQHSARDYVFAGWAALHTGDTGAARVLWHRALRIDPRFKPAAIALAEHSQ